MQRIVSIMMVSAAVTVAGIITAGTHENSRSEWTRIDVREAFVSRKTSIDFRDPNSPAEFGWHVKRGGVFAARGGSLYSTMFVPFPPAEQLQLYLVELDVFSDDIVSGVDLEEGKSKYVLNANGDFAVLERTAFFPDRNSGGDALPESAPLIVRDTAGSVSFLNGDYTDCFRIPDGSFAAVIISRSMSLAVDAPGVGHIIIHPRNRSMASVKMASSEGGGVLRLRGPVGGGETEYHILVSMGKKNTSELLGRAIKYLDAGERAVSSFRYRDLARACMSYDPAAAIAWCSGKGGTGSADRSRLFCDTVEKSGKTTSP